MPWMPGRRRASVELEDPFDDVPPHLVQPLWDWFVKSVTSQGGYLDGAILFRIGLELRIAFPDPRSETGQVALSQIRDAVINDATVLLDAIEIILRSDFAFGRNVEELRLILSVGNSAYEVNPDENGLQVRIPAPVRDQVQNVVEIASVAAATHLAAAWNCAYSRVPDPVKAYSEAIKGVEAASIPVVSPNHEKATLGTVLGELRSNPTKWAVDIGDSMEIDGAVGMLKMLWDGQSSRHAGVGETRHETASEAKTAIHLASTLIQWFSSGAVRKV